MFEGKYNNKSLYDLFPASNTTVDTVTTPKGTTLNLENMLDDMKRLKEEFEKPVAELFKKLGGKFGEEVLFLPKHYEGTLPQHRDIVYSKYLLDPYFANKQALNIGKLKIKQP